MCSNIGSGVVDDVTLGKNDYFGERSLLTDEPRAADVTAVTHVECITISREVRRAVAGGNQKEMKSSLLSLRGDVLVGTADPSVPDGPVMRLATYPLVSQVFTSLLGSLRDVMDRVTLRRTLPSLPVFRAMPVRVTPRCPHAHHPPRVSPPLAQHITT